MKKIPLTQGQFALVDNMLFDSVSKYKWYLDHYGKSYYAARQSQNKTIRMHQFILGRQPGMVIDHIDGNGLNNTISNLRFVSHAMNILNCNRRKGYYFDKTKKRFICRVRVGNKVHILGRFIHEKGAINLNKELLNAVRKGRDQLNDFITKCQNLKNPIGRHLTKRTKTTAFYRKG